MDTVLRVETKTLWFLPMAVCPLDGDDLEIHEWLDVIGHVADSLTGKASAEIVSCDRAACRWFARCANYATHAEPHPALGFVPACDRCVKIGRD